MQEFDDWVNRLSKDEKILLILLVIHGLVTTIAYLFYRTNTALLYLLLGLMTLGSSLFLVYFVIPRKRDLTEQYHLDSPFSRFERNFDKEILDRNYRKSKGNEIETIRFPSKPSPLTKVCEFCLKPELLPFQCKYCSSYFCSDHRLPERHQCKGLHK